MDEGVEVLIVGRQGLDEQIAKLRVERNELTDKIRERKRKLSAEHAQRLAEIRGPTAEQYARTTGKIGSYAARDLCGSLSSVPTSSMDMTINARQGILPAERYHGRWLFDPEEVSVYAAKVAAHGIHAYKEGGATNRWDEGEG